MIFLAPRKRELLDISPLLRGRKIYTEKSEENHTTFVWLSSLLLLPRSACRIPLLWAIVSCPHRSLPATPIILFFTFQLIFPPTPPTLNPCDLSPQTESGNAITPDLLPRTKSNCTCKHQVRKKLMSHFFADVMI